MAVADHDWDGQFAMDYKMKELAEARNKALEDAALAIEAMPYVRGRGHDGYGTYTQAESFPPTHRQIVNKIRSMKTT